MAVIFRCPNCGASIVDQEDKSILTCKQCGTTVTKYIKQVNQIDVNIQNTVRDTAAEEKQKVKKIEAITELIFVIAFIAFWVYFFSKR